MCIYQNGDSCECPFTMNGICYNPGDCEYLSEGDTYD